MDAFYKLCRLEGIIPAVESSHALAYAIRYAKEHETGSILVNLSGRGDKDMDFVVEKFGLGNKDETLKEESAKDFVANKYGLGDSFKEI